MSASTMQDLTQEQAIGLLALDLKEMFDGREGLEVSVEAGADARGNRQLRATSSFPLAEGAPAATLGAEIVPMVRSGLEERLWNVAIVFSQVRADGPRCDVTAVIERPPDGWPQVPE